MRLLRIGAAWVVTTFAAGLAASFRDIEDSSVLVQIEHVQAQQYTDASGIADTDSRTERMGADTALTARRKWPTMGEVWEDIKESMENVTGHYGDITQSVNEGLAHAYNETVEAIVLGATKALNRALYVITNSSEQVLNSTLEMKRYVLKFLRETEEVLPLFAFVFNTTIVAASDAWTLVRSVLATAGAAVCSGLSAAGQDGLASILSKALEGGTQKVDEFMVSLNNSSNSLTGFEQRVRQEPYGILMVLDRQLKSSLRYVPEFALIFQKAIQDVLDLLTDALPYASHSINHEMGAVQHNVTSILWHLHSSSRELVTTLHSAVGVVAREVHVELPSWEARPPQRPPQQPSASRRAGIVASIALLVSLTAFF